MTREDVAAQEEFEVWPENWDAVMLFVDLMTQWRMGMGSPVALDYAAIPVVMDLNGTPAYQRRELFDAIRVMEVGALEAMRRK